MLLCPLWLRYHTHWASLVSYLSSVTLLHLLFQFREITFEKDLLMRPASPPQLFWRYCVLCRLIFYHMSLLEVSVGLSEWFPSMLGNSRHCHLESLQAIHSYETISQSIALRGWWTTDFYFKIVILQWLFLLFPTSKPSLILIFMCTYSLLTLSFLNVLFLIFRDFTSYLPIPFDFQTTPEKKSHLCYQYTYLSSIACLF